MAFPVTCPACGKAFQLATEIYERKVAGKIVSIKCKQCQAGIRVDATQPGELKVLGATPPGGSDLSVGPKPPEAPQAKAAPAAPNVDPPKPAPAPTAVRMRQPTLIGMMSPNATAQNPMAPVIARPATLTSTTPSLWAVDSGGTGDDRELNEDEIKREIQAGSLGPQTLAWREGMAEWLEIEKIPELNRFLAPPAREEPKREEPKREEPKREEPKREEPKREEPKREEPKPQEREAERQVVREGAPARPDFQDDPDAEATMVYRSAPNAALEPFLPPDQEKTERVMLGQTAPLGAPPPPPLPAAGRPASFAKTAPLAEPPPPPLPPPARPAPPAQPVAARPLPPPAQAPAAPAPAAPAFPKPAAPAPVLAAVPWGDALPSAKPPAQALPTVPYGPDPFAVAATTDLDFPSPRSKKPLMIAVVVGIVVAIGIVIAIASSSSPPVANIAAPPPARTTQPESPKAAEPTPTSEPVRDDSRDPSAPATVPATPTGNFSDLFSKGVKGSGSGQATRGFDEAQARGTLSGVLKAAAACKEPGGPTGQTTATVTFDPSGNVSGVTVGAPFAGTSTGTCIITAFKRARVAPFTGLPGTVSQIISLR